MKKNYFSLLFLLYSSIYMYSQSIGQDTDGYSNLILASAQLNLDVANSIATIDYVDYFNNKKDNVKYLYGLRLSGKAENGVSVLFSNKKIAASSTIDGLVGCSFTKEIKYGEEKSKSLLNKIKELDKELDKEIESYKMFLKKTLPKNTINPLMKILNTNSGIHTKKEKLPTSKLNEFLNNLIETYTTKVTELKLKIGDENASENDMQIRNANEIYDNIKSELKKVINISEKYDEAYKEWKSFALDSKYIHHLVFFRGGFNGSSFKYDLNNGGTTIDDRFKTQTLNGWQAELGYNFNSGNDYLGASFSIAHLNNLSGLTEVEYTLSQTNESITGGTITTTQSINAFTGNYDEYLRHSLNVDYSRLIPIEEKAGGLYLSINTYLRHRLYNRSETIKDHTVLGAGLFAINSKKNQLLGGIFIQTNDLFGNHYATESTLGERITFGLLAKYAFSGTEIK